MLANPGLSKAKPPMGFVSLMKNALFASPLPFEREVSPDMVFVISYRMWLKRRVNPPGVPFFIGQGWRAKRVTLPTDVCEWATPSVLCFLWIWMCSYFVFRISADEIKKAQHRWRCAPLNILTQGSSLCLPTLGYQKRNPYGVLLSHEKRSLCAAFPFERDEIKNALHRWRWKGHIKWWYIVFIVRISMIMHYNRRINTNQ